MLALVLPAFADVFLQGDAAGPGMAAQVNLLSDTGGFTGAERVTTSCADIVVGPVVAMDRAADPSSPLAGSVLSTVFFVAPGASPATCTVYVDGAPLAALSAGIDNAFSIVTPSAAPVDGGVNDADGAADGVITLASSLRSDGGTLVLDGLDVPAGVTLIFDTSDPVSGTDGNEAFLPVFLRVDGDVTIDGTIDVAGLDGDDAPAGRAADGGDGGPGGGGGGVGSNCVGPASYFPGDGFTGGGGTATGTCIDFTYGGTGAVEGPDGEDGGEGLFTDVANGALGYAGGVGGGTGSPWGTGGGGGYCCGVSGDGGFGGGGGNGHSESSGWGGGGGGFGTDGENGVGTVGGGRSSYQVGGAGLENGDATLVPLAGGSGGAGGDSGAGGADGAGGGGGGGSLLIQADQITFGSAGLIAAWGGNGGDTVGTNPGSSTGGAGGSGGGVHLSAWLVSGAADSTLSLNGGYGGREYNGYYSGDGGEGRLRVDGAAAPTLSAGVTGGAPSTFEGAAFTSVVDTDVTISSSGPVTLYVYDAGGYVTDLALAADGSATLYPYLVEGTNYLVLVDDTTGVMSPAGAATITYDPDADDDGHDAPRYGGDDCDDSDPSVSPSATELCNGLDDDCDGTVDEDDAADAGIWYTDADGDGYGDDSTALVQCDTPVGAVTLGGDCDDTDAAYNPGALEDDCTDPNDYNCDGSVAYADVDGDAWAACEECDDSDAAVNPDATEVCNGVDDDCDGTVDEEDASDASTWYRDIDGDGHGAGSGEPACSEPDGYAASNDDCDDTDAGVAPGNVETCNGIDDNCDGVADEGLTGTWYADEDGDGYGDPNAPLVACEQPDGAVTDATDCDDTDASIHPFADDPPGDGIDQDCVGGDTPGDTGGDTAPTDTAPDTAPDTDTDTAPDTDLDDTGPAGDSAAPTLKESYEGGGGCGCDTPGSGAVGWAALGALALVARRRR